MPMAKERRRSWDSRVRSSRICSVRYPVHWRVRVLVGELWTAGRGRLFLYSCEGGCEVFDVGGCVRDLVFGINIVVGGCEADR